MKAAALLRWADRLERLGFKATVMTGLVQLVILPLSRQRTLPEDGPTVGLVVVLAPYAAVVVAIWVAKRFPGWLTGALADGGATPARAQLVRSAVLALLAGSCFTNGAYQLELASWAGFLIASVSAGGVATGLAAARHLGVCTSQPAPAPTEERR